MSVRKRKDTPKVDEIRFSTHLITSGDVHSQSTNICVMHYSKQWRMFIGK